MKRTSRPAATIGSFNNGSGNGVRKGQWSMPVGGGRRGGGVSTSSFGLVVRVVLGVILVCWLMVAFAVLEHDGSSPTSNAASLEKETGAADRARLAEEASMLSRESAEAEGGVLRGGKGERQKEQPHHVSPYSRGTGEDPEMQYALAAVHPRVETTTHTTDEYEMIDMRQLNRNLAFDNPKGEGGWTQGWDVPPVQVSRKKPLRIFVLPHSHCDPGWIKTFDAYFQTQTKQILTSVYNALLVDQRRKFVWAEISYFEWWWREQTQDVQERMSRLIHNKQFEFVTGGWVQPDEANTQRYAIEVQLQEGHDWLRQTFGDAYVPRYGWSIDPFGYSPTMAHVLREHDFKGMLIQRVHYAVKKELALHQNLEFMWRQTWDPVGSRDIFTHVMPFYSYDVPHTCGPDPSVCCQFDFARMSSGYGKCPWKKNPQTITSQNVAERALLLLDQYRRKAALYRSGVVLAPLGDDFRYQTTQEAEAQYTNYQKIFDYINDKVEGVTISFGTLSEYFEAVEGSFQPPVLQGSFFTYSDRDEDYWSGYFTSRVFDKALDRKLERALYAAATMGIDKKTLQKPRRDLSLFQHHDGVTGTAKDHVVVDYAERMFNSIRKVQMLMLQKLPQSLEEEEEGGNALTALQPCDASDGARIVSENRCDHSQPVYMYNPLPLPQTCGSATIPPRKTVRASLPCETPGPTASSKGAIKFDPNTGWMTSPVKEEWMVWNVQKGGAYLFVPGELSVLQGNFVVEQDGYVVSAPNWKRRIIERKGPNDDVTTFDVIFETNLQIVNQEWIVRFSSSIDNGGVFHTDLNGFNYDTHYFRRDLPIQSQVFPMPTLASIEDEHTRFTVLSEHAQGTASLEPGAIDVWLDRRLNQDDERGLGQGVRDNVLTRTKLRLVLERGGYEKSSEAEFSITETCKVLWDELNHPLEMFGTHKSSTPEGQGNVANEVSSASVSDRKKKKHFLVPFVYMVYKRIEYLERSIASLRESDFPRDKVPLVISIDGRVPEMIDYVASLKMDFIVVQLIHPFACHDHPFSFPGNATELNEGYEGDKYGNPRSEWATCAKHHWNWMMKTAFEHDYGKTMNHLFVMEEDYIVAPTIYETIESGLQMGEEYYDPESLFGLVLDPSNGGVDKLNDDWPHGFMTRAFRTGPFVMSRKTWTKVREQAQAYCTYDEYNWDWTLVHCQTNEFLPFKVLAPSIPQVHHIGDYGMHGFANEAAKKRAKEMENLQPFHGTMLLNSDASKRKGKPNGGWGHPRDQNHCVTLLSLTGETEAVRPER